MVPILEHYLEVVSNGRKNRKLIVHISSRDRDSDQRPKDPDQHVKTRLTLTYRPAADLLLYQAARDLMCFEYCCQMIEKFNYQGNLGTTYKCLI